MNLTTLDSSYKWNHTTFVFLWLHQLIFKLQKCYITNGHQKSKTLKWKYSHFNYLFTHRGVCPIRTSPSLSEFSISCIWKELMCILLLYKFPDPLEKRQDSSWHRLGEKIPVKVCKLFSVCYTVGKNKQVSEKTVSKLKKYQKHDSNHSRGKWYLFHSLSTNFWIN